MRLHPETPLEARPAQRAATDIRRDAEPLCRVVLPANLSEHLIGVGEVLIDVGALSLRLVSFLQSIFVLIGLAALREIVERGRAAAEARDGEAFVDQIEAERFAKGIIVIDEHYPCLR